MKNQKLFIIIHLLLLNCFSVFCQDQAKWDSVNSDGTLIGYHNFILQNMKNKGIYYDSAIVKLNQLLVNQKELSAEFITKIFEENIAPFKFTELIKEVKVAMNTEAITMKDHCTPYNGSQICYSIFRVPGSNPHFDIYEKNSKNELGKIYIYKNDFIDLRIKFTDKNKVLQEYSRVNGKWYEFFRFTF